MSSKLSVAISMGKTVWLKQLLSELLPSLPREPDRCHVWFNELIGAFENRGLLQPKQQKNFLTDVRNAIRVLDPEHPALNIVKFEKDTWIEINNSATDRIAERETQLLSNPQAIVERAVELLQSYQWSEIAAGLAVVTGRRSTEVLKTAKFEYRTPYSVSFSGSLKRRGELTKCVFDIPTLCESKLVLEAISHLKERLGKEIMGLSPRQISGRYSRAVSQKCDHNFFELVPNRTGKDNLYTHLFRSVYSTIASYWYCPPNVPEIEYRAAIQGHYQILDEKNPELRRSLAAGRNYFDYKVSDGKGNIDGRLGIKLGMPGVEVIPPFTWNKPEILTSKPQVKKTQPKKVMQQLITVPSYLASRLEGLSQQLGTESNETLKVLFEWAEIGIALSRDLGLEEANPNELYEEVQRIKRQSDGQLRHENNDVQDDLPIDASNIRDLCTSVRLLAETVATQNQVTVVRDRKKAKAVTATLPREFKVPVKLPEGETRENQNEGKPSQYRLRGVEAEKSVSRAIDTIMEHNDKEETSFTYKFRVGVGCVRKLSGRGDSVINRVLKARAEEIKAHNEKHKFSKTHNSKGKEFPPIDEIIDFERD